MSTACVAHCCPPAPLSPLSLVCFWQALHIFLWAGAGTLWHHHSHMECSLPTRCKVIARGSTAKHRYSSISLLPLVKEDEVRRGVSVYWEKTAVWSHKLHLEKWLSLQVRGLLREAALTCKNRSKKISEGECKWVFLLWEECSLSIGRVEECQTYHIQSFIYCHLSKNLQPKYCEEGFKFKCPWRISAYF